jgi:hypothetical protein
MVSKVISLRVTRSGPVMAAKIPEAIIGTVMSQDEAQALLKKLE